MMEDNMETQGFEQWNGFHGETWKKCIDVQDFIHQNVASYEGDDSFLMGATERQQQRLMQKLNQLLSVEACNFWWVFLDIDTQEVSSLTAYQPGVFRQRGRVDCWFTNQSSVKTGSESIWRD